MPHSRKPNMCITQIVPIRSLYSRSPKIYTCPHTDPSIPLSRKFSLNQPYPTSLSSHLSAFHLHLLSTSDYEQGTSRQCPRIMLSLPHLGKALCNRPLLVYEVLSKTLSCFVWQHLSAGERVFRPYLCVSMLSLLLSYLLQYIRIVYRNGLFRYARS